MIEALDLGQVVLIGHSMGGPVIVEAAQRVPDRVAALIPVDYFQDVSQTMTEAQRREFVAPLEADFETAAKEFVRTMFGPRAAPALIDRVVVDMATGPREVGLGSMRHLLTYADAAELAETTAPIRMINADQWPTNLDAARQARPDLELAIMGGTGHFVMLEDPDEFNAQIEEALDELL